MKCDNSYLPLISGHIDGCNSEIEEKRLQQHLKTCRHCRELLEIMEGNDALLIENIEQPPVDLTARIMDAVSKEPKKQRSRKRFYFTTAAAGLAAAAMLCFAVMGDKLPLLSTKSDSALNELESTQTYSAMSTEAQHENPLQYKPADEDVFEDTEPSDSPGDAPKENTPEDELSEPVAEVEPSKSPDKAPQEEQPADVPAETEQDPADVPAGTEQGPIESQDSHTTSSIGKQDIESFDFTLPASIAKGLSGGHIGNRFNYDAKGTDSIPTLVIWDAQVKDLRLPFSATKCEFGAQNSSAGKLSLYDHFASALFALCQPTFIGSDGSKFITPAYNSELYVLSYEELCDLFMSCTGKFELAVYFPKDPDLDGDCQLILINNAKATSERGRTTSATE